MAAQLYSNTQLATALFEVLQELVAAGQVPESLAVATLDQVRRGRACADACVQSASAACADARPAAAAARCPQLDQVRAAAALMRRMQQQQAACMAPALVLRSPAHACCCRLLSLLPPLSPCRQSILNALKNEIPAKAEIKGGLDTYKYYDNVSTCSSSSSRPQRQPQAVAATLRWGLGRRRSNSAWTVAAAAAAAATLEWPLGVARRVHARCACCADRPAIACPRPLPTGVAVHAVGCRVQAQRVRHRLAQEGARGDVREGQGDLRRHQARAGQLIANWSCRRVQSRQRSGRKLKALRPRAVTRSGPEANEALCAVQLPRSIEVKQAL